MSRESFCYTVSTSINNNKPVSHGEISVALKCANEKEQKSFVHYQLAKEPKSLFFANQFWSFPLQHYMIINVWEKDFHSICAIIEERNAT